nr:EOG090X0ARU [Polyphemus pediculus]
MYKRKLHALGYPNPGMFNASDSKQFQSMVVWLEDQKIRRYKIEERESLRKTLSGEEWDKAFSQYLSDLECPVSSCPKNEILDWLLGLAVHFEFSENVELYSGNKEVTDKVKSTVKMNPLDNLDFNSDEFKNGVNALADMLKIPRHIDHLVTLDAVCNLVKEKLDSGKLKTNQTAQGVPLQFDIIDSGYEFQEKNLRQAASALRYLFIHDLRDLQTSINECIVSVQALTANPKTNTSLGQVGFK